MYIVLSSDFTTSDFTRTLRVLAVAILKLRGEKVAEIKNSVLTPADRTAMAKVAKGLGITESVATDVYDNLLKAAITDSVSIFVVAFRKGLNSGRIKHDGSSTTSATRDVLPPILTLLSTPTSESAFATLQRRIGGLGSSALSAAYVKNAKESVESPDSITEKLKALVKKYAKIDGTTIPTEQLKTLRDKYPEDIREYGRLKRQLSVSNSALIRSAVVDVLAATNTKGKDYISLQQLAKWMKEHGIKNSTIHPGLFKSKFLGINIDGKLVDNRGIRVVGSENPQHSATVEVNPNYNPNPSVKGNNWIFSVHTGKSVNRAQPEDVIAAKRGQKFDRIDTKVDDLEAVARKWRTKMIDIGPKTNIEDTKVVYPYFAEYLYQTSSRVGSGTSGKTGDTTTYGAGNFMVSAVKKSSKGLIAIKYHIKGAKEQDFLLATSQAEADDKKAVSKLIEFMQEKMKDKAVNEVLFSVADRHGEPERMNTSDFSRWLQTVAGIKPHDVRSLRGTKIASEVLPPAAEKVKKLLATKPLAENAVNKIFEEAVTEVGKRLGHVRRSKGEEMTTPATAISYYISPKLMIAWWREVGYAPPTKVVKAAHKSGIEV